MALVSPILDNRTYEQLKQELIRRIPVYAPEWTNHNESDPGIALLELFAYLGESLLYRFNQIPETARLQFLKMLGFQPRAAQSAEVLVAATTDLPKGVGVPKGAEVKAGALRFETEDEVFVWPLEVLAAGKSSAEANPEDDTIKDVLGKSIQPSSTAAFYRTKLLPDDPLRPEAEVIQVSAQVDGALWIALLSKPTTDVVHLNGRILFIGVAFSDEVDQEIRLEHLDKRAAIYKSDDLTDDPPPMVWRLWKGDPKAEAPKAFEELKVAKDTTGGLTRDGVVKLELPAIIPTIQSGSEGVAHQPPPLSDPNLVKRVIAWIQVARPERADIGDKIGRVRWVGINVVHAVQERMARSELVGTGTGDGDQSYSLNNRPIRPGSVVLQVEEPAGWETWEEVDSFASTTVHDRHYRVDVGSGAVIFGRARVPQIGERIRVVSYKYGGGAAGNVAAGAVNALSDPGGVKVSNPLPAAGGRDMAGLEEAMSEIPGAVHRNDRCVILDDFRQLSEEVAGVSRAEPVPNLHPEAPDILAAGVVTVVIFPTEDLRNPAAPMPDLSLLRRTARYLDARRLVTTELYVIPPEYVKISLSVSVQVKEGYQVDAVRRWVELILRQYLAPLGPFGPDGKGWPLGRTVRRPELEAVAVQVEGVAYLIEMLLGTLGEGGVVPAVDGLVAMRAWQVPELAEIAVVGGGPALPLGSIYAPKTPEMVPVPLPPEEC